jgi:hypothetical protein
MNDKQAERREVLLNDLDTLFRSHPLLRPAGHNAPTTFSQLAAAEADLEAQGRFAKATPTEVRSVPRYPAGPEWSKDPTGIEPPFGVDVSAPPPAVGTLAEQQAAEERLAASAQNTNPLSSGGSPPNEKDAGDERT